MRLIILLSLAASLFIPSASWASLITPEQAKAAVRAFESDPNLQFSSVTLDDGSAPMTYSLPHEYNLTYTGPQDTSIDWAVDAATGEVISADYNNFYPGEVVTEDTEDSEDTGYTKEPHGAFNQQQCFKIAHDFVYSKISNFDSLNYRLINEGNWNGYNWDFTWQEILPNEAKTPNGVSINVNPDDGKVLLFRYNKREFDGSKWAIFITPEQAIQAVRNFESDAGLQFSDVILHHDDHIEPWEHGNEYTLSINNEELKWHVDAVSGEVTAAFYPDNCTDGESDEDYDEPAGSWTREQCRQAAEDFVRSHYSGIGVLNMQPDDEGTCNRGTWDFTWREILPCGATTPNCAIVYICPFDGRVSLYFANRILMPTPPDPKLNAQQALAIVAKAIKIKDHGWDGEPTLIANPEGIFWSGIVNDAEYSLVDYCVEVDAVSGRITRNERMVAAGMDSLSANVKTSKSQISKSGNPLVAIRKAITSLSGATVQWISGTGAKLAFNGCTYIIKPNKKVVKWGSGSLTLSQKPVLKNNRLMVPQDFIGKLVKSKFQSLNKAKSVKQAPVSKIKKR